MNKRVISENKKKKKKKKRFQYVNFDVCPAFKFTQCCWKNQFEILNFEILKIFTIVGLTGGGGGGVVGSAIDLRKCNSRG